MCICEGVYVCVYVCKCEGVYVCGCEGVYVCKCEGVYVCKCEGVYVCKCEGVYVCKCEGVYVCGCDLGLTVVKEVQGGRGHLGSPGSSTEHHQSVPADTARAVMCPWRRYIPCLPRHPLPHTSTATSHMTTVTSHMTAI